MYCIHLPMDQKSLYKSGKARRERQSLRARCGRSLQGNVFWTLQGRFTYEVKAIVTACTKPAQAQGRPNPRIEREAGTKSYP